MSEGRVIVAFLTGQSDPRSNALSPVQRGFFERSPVLEEERLRLNFPYVPSMEWRETPLIRASISNASQYFTSRRPDFSQRYREGFLGAFGGAGAVILLAGSCGLELLVNLRLPESFRRVLHVFAYGPVSRSVPDCASLVLVQGSRDAISRHWHRKVDHVIPCGHMEYLETEEMMRLFTSFYQRVTSPRA